MRLLLLLLLPLLFCTDGWKSSALLPEPLTFDVEPPGRLEFLLSEGGSVACGAQGDASVTVQWVYADGGQPVTNVSRLREVYPDRLIFPGVSDELYQADVHHRKYRCRASSSHGTILSRVVHVEAAVRQEMVATVGEQFVSEGDVAVLSCHLPASLDRWVTVSAWTLGQQLVAQRGMPPSTNGTYEMLDSGQLLVSSVMRADSGHEFSCVVKHRLTHQQHTSTPGRITVLDPRVHHPVTVVPAAKRRKVTKKVGERITLLCEAHGNPLPAYTWYKVDESGSRVKLQRGHQEGPHHPARTINDLTLDDSGTYVCQAANQLGQDEAEITLCVTGDSLTVRVLPERQVVVYGDPATLSCQHEGGHVERTYWLKDGHPLEVTGCEMRVESVREGEVGMYQCFVENDLVTAQASAIIAVGPEMPPRWEVEPEESVRVEVGGSVTIPCRASGVPTPTLTWTKFKGHSRQPVESVALCDLGVRTTRDGTLVVGEVRRTHAGYFICSADNGVGSGIEAVVMLQVVAAPEVTPFSPLVRVPEGQDAELRCLVEGADGEGVVWSKDGHIIHYHLNPKYRVFTENEGDGVVVSRFIVVTAGPQDAGQYICSAASVWAAAQAGVSLVVEADGMEHSVPRYGIQTSHEKELGQILEDIDKWGIDIFKVAELSNGLPLTAIMYTIFKKRGLIDAFHMNPRRLVSFLGAVEGRYNPVPFHNSLHSADIAQSAHVLLTAPSIKGKFTNLEIMATLFACAIHDVDHQGRTNQCLNPSTTIPQVENETELEQHHLSVGFYLLESGDLDFLSSLSAEEMQHFEELVKEIVLGTNLMKHPGHKAFLKSKIEGGSGNTCGNLALEDSQDRIKLLSSVVHVADLSTAAKPFSIYVQWARAIMQEFFTQGDSEKLLGQSVAPLCDRTVADIDQTQVGFLDHFVLPLWESWAQLHPYADYMLAILRGNRDKYRGPGPVHQPL